LAEGDASPYQWCFTAILKIVSRHGRSRSAIN
jgi:hypothetical protein